MPSRKTAPPAAPATIDAQPLTDFQETVCNPAADLILNGGEESDVSNLLRSTIGHRLHPRFEGHARTGSNSG